MVVTLQHNINLVLVKQGLPAIPDAWVVSSVKRRVDRVMHGDNRPAAGIVGQNRLEPEGLLGMAVVGVEDHNARVLVVYIVDLFFHSLRSVVWQLKDGIPVR